jgi:hypothetical protein
MGEAGEDGGVEVMSDPIFVPVAKTDWGHDFWEKFQDDDIPPLPPTPDTSPRDKREDHKEAP